MKVAAPFKLALLISIVLTASPFTLLSATNEIRVGPGDDKHGYENSDYLTDSLSLEKREGVSADLYAIANKQQLGLPNASGFQELIPDEKQIELGRKLFFDRRLSRNKTMSCAMCHIPEQGFSNNELKRPIGFEGRAVKRNAPTLLNVVFKERLFVDARENKLSQQAWSPLLAENEMNNPSVGQVIDQLDSDKFYNSAFKDAFKTSPNMINVGQAFAQYQQALVAGNSRFDRWYFLEQEQALNVKEISGFKLFIGKAGCVSCHRIDKDNALFTDNKLHNTGVGFQASMLNTPGKVRVQLAPGLSTLVDQDVISAVGEEKPNDLGRYEVTQDPADRWKYLTPSLRNVAITAPYMHNGEFLTLDDVIDFYNRGGEKHDLLSPLIKPLGLSKTETSALGAFLNTLNGGNIQTLISDSFAAPIGDQR